MNFDALIAKYNGTVINDYGGDTPCVSFIRSAKDAGDDCVIWKFHVNNSGYGTLRINNKTVYAHRISLELHSGVVPKEGQQACHSCNNRLCINPSHLRWGSRVENMADARKHGTLAIGERVGGSKLTTPQVIEIKKDKRSLREVASEYGVSIGTVCDIRKKRTWAWL